MGKANSQVCAHCNITENAKHVIMHCVKYKEERVRLQQKVREAGRSWDLEGILGTNGDKVRETQRGLIEFLIDTGLFNRI